MCSKKPPRSRCQSRRDGICRPYGASWEIGGASVLHISRSYGAIARLLPGGENAHPAPPGHLCHKALYLILLMITGIIQGQAIAA